MYLSNYYYEKKIEIVISTDRVSVRRLIDWIIQDLRLLIMCQLY